jgi:hypothetical protein
MGDFCRGLRGIGGTGGSDNHTQDDTTGRQHEPAQMRMSLGLCTTSKVFVYKVIVIHGNITRNFLMTIARKMKKFNPLMRLIVKY